ncbi:hypothetical protein ACMD2_16059 [Ananas comosus]|uniref:Uncharacterized protein n=1 Tax=Ananas comosus TaxID=4615 RepID=A0A199W8I5_ANACO|nr:hypothetical protein ACMD2_16059 [Ananas comosus]
MGKLRVLYLGILSPEHSPKRKHTRRGIFRPNALSDESTCESRCEHVRCEKQGFGRGGGEEEEERGGEDAAASGEQRIRTKQSKWLDNNLQGR